MKRSKIQIEDRQDGRWALVRETTFTKYYVNDAGRCRRVDKRTGHVADSYGSPNEYTGYMQFANSLVHRLVAAAFVKRPRGKAHVDHVNGDRRDNRACNLRWTTRKAANSTDRARRLKSQNGRRTIRDGQVIRASKDGAVRFFKNGYEAARGIGCSHVLVYNCLNGAGSARRA